MSPESGLEEDMCDASGDDSDDAATPAVIYKIGELSHRVHERPARFCTARLLHESSLRAG